MTVEASVVVVSDSSKFKQEEAEIKNGDNGEVVAAVVGVDSGDGETTVTAAAASTTTSSTADSSSRKKKKKKGIDTKKTSNRIQVSNTKKPFMFYLNLAKRYINQYNDVELSALGMAIPTVVTIAEVLKRDGLANSKEINISTVDSKEDRKGHFTKKAKIQIVMGKADKLDKTITAATSLMSAIETKA